MRYTKNVFVLFVILLGWSRLFAQTYHLGDIYEAPDGSQGIVYYLNPDGSGGLVVALHDASAGCSWGELVDIPSLQSYIRSDSYNTPVHVLMTDTSGYTNTIIIRAFQNNNPSFAAGVVDIANGWVLPSLEQLAKLFGQLPFISAALVNAGGEEPAYSRYWCSAECDSTRAWVVNFENSYSAGNFLAMNKANIYRVRAVRSFSYKEPQPELSYTWSTGDTTTSITVTPDQTTTYTVIATTSGGCADTVEHTVVVNSVEPQTFYDEVCQGEPYFGNGFVVTAEETSQPGIVSRTRTEEVNGCETTYTLELTVNASPYINIEETACDSYEWNGQLLTSSGDYTLSYPYPGGCDSTVTLHLTIIPMPMLNHTPDTVIQAGSSATLWASGADYLYWTDSNDNVLYSGSSLTINPLTTTTYFINGQNYSDGSDNLVVNGDFEQGNIDFISDYLPLTSQYMSYGHYTITTDGYLHFLGTHLYGYNGTGKFMLVDGATTLNTVVWQQTVPVTPHTYYAFSAQVASTHHSNASGAYALLQFSVNSSQLGDIFHSPDVLNVWKPYYEVWYSGDNTSATLSILNQNTSLNGNDFGIDEITFSPITECSVTDSILVTVLPQCDTIDFADFACDSYEWNDETYTETGDYTQTFTTTSGCDSMVTLHLTVNYGTHNAFTETACDHYIWHEVEYAESGVYEYEYVNDSGCPSTDTLHLTVNSSTYSTIDVTVAENELPYIINGESYDTAGTYTQALTNVSGCDSLLTINMSVIPAVLPDNVDSAECVVDALQQPWDAQVLHSVNDIHCYFTPLVGDIDGDGEVEIVASKVTSSSYHTTLLGIYRGSDLQQIGTISVPQKIYSGFAGPAALVRYPNGDGGMQGAIVLHCSDKKLRSYDINGQLLATSDVNTPCEGVVSIADFNADGWPEVYVGNVVYDAATLKQLCAGPTTGNMGRCWRGDPSDSSNVAMSLAKNVLGDLTPELICGNSIYSVNIISRTDVSQNSVDLVKTIPIPNHIPQDGNVSVVDFDMDGQLEVLVTIDETPSTVLDSSFVYAYNPVTEEILFVHGRRVLTVGYPLVGDIDGDGWLEFVYIDEQHYVNNARINAMKYIPSTGLQTMWQAAHTDGSGQTSMTLFDFNQDGIMEIVYRDEDNLRIINGSGKSHLTGNDTIPFYNLYTLGMTAGTWNEYPLVADVNNDGRAEIVVCGRTGSGLSYFGGQLVVLGGIHPWAPARKVWNQYMYNVTNVNEDLTIPQYQFNNATAFTDPEGVVRRPFNNFLQQATTIDQYGRPFYVVPDVAMETSTSSQMQGNDTVALTFSYCNMGDNTLNAPYTITVFANAYGGDVVGTATINESLPVDSCAQGGIQLPISVLCGFSNLDSLVIAVNCAGAGIAQNGGQQPECDTTNNTATVPVTLHIDTTHLTATACDTYFWYGDTLTQSGEYTHTLTSTNGCDSVVTLHLTVNSTYHEDLHVSSCDEYEWNGETYAESGEYEHVFTAANGCDSVETLHLTIIPCSLPDNVDSADCVFLPEGTEWAIGQPMVSDAYLSMCSAVPMVGDVDDDGQQEIVMHTDSKVLIFNDDATLKTQFNVCQSRQEGQLGLAKVRYQSDEFKTIIVVYSTVNKYLYAYDATGNQLWQSSQPFGSYNGESYQLPAISFADFNHDGWTEIFVGSEIFDAATGVFLGKTNGNLGYARRTWENNYSTYQSSAADLYGDANLELAVGNTVYGVHLQSRTDASMNQITPVKTLSLENMVMADGTAIPFTDGNTFLVDINLDGKLDVLALNVDPNNRVVYVYVWDVESQTLLCSKKIPNSRKFGMPQIGDLDNDGYPEICFITGTYINHTPGNNETIYALKYNSQAPNGEMDVFWTTPHTDYSGATSLTLFDFNQDGLSELVYRDETHLRIINGSLLHHQTGEVVSQPYDIATYACGSGTALEYPIVCDVDQDGAAEIIIASSCVSNSHYGHLYIFKSAGIPWAPARKVWNQYMYNVTNVNEDLTIPQYQFNNATVFTDPQGVVRRPFNNFLQQATTIDQYGRPFYAVPDVAMESSASSQRVGDSLVLTFSYCNLGDNALNAPYPVTIFANTYGGDTVCTVTIGESLPVDSCTQGEIRVPVSALCGFQSLDALVIAVNGNVGGIAQNGGLQPECDTTNNTVAVSFHMLADTTHLTVSACESYLWFGDTLVQSGEYPHLLTNSHGCDSLVILHLSLNTTSANTLSVNIVENNLPFTLNDSSYTVPGTYYQHFTNAAGCDSTLTIVLNVYYNQTVEVDSTICQSELPLTWNHVIFTQGGTLSDTLLTSHGADSIVVMTLHVNPVPEAVISGLITLCSDSVVTLTADSAYSYLWSTGETTQTITVAEEGGYTLTVTNEFGCSSTATHYLMPLGNPIISVTVPEMCAGGSYVLSVGYHPDNNIHLGQGATTLSLTDTIFLPDGVYCEPFGCSYRSPLTFTAYADGDTIQSADDIYYVRLNMEHSYVGDLYINITCPNGQKADLLKYGGNGGSECNSQIASSSRGWNSAGNNMGYSNYFGDAYDYDVSSCDATVFGNEPGVGWNYCWSNNTTQGYVYAPGEGSLIYRFVNAHDGSVDSSDVAAGTQFYHPDDSFSNLIGCPLNGSWYIEVQDGWSYDNGYIFGWELSLSNEMLPDVSFELDYSTAQGPWITPLSDTLFQVDPPADLAHDTVIAYTFTVYDTTGCGYDTTISITFHATSHTEIDTIVCESFTWNDIVYTQSGQYVYHLMNAVGCDSVLTLNVTVNSPTDSTVNVTVLENNLPYVFNGSIYEDPGTYYQTLENALGCDSTITINLTVLYNVTTNVDSTVCDNELPIIWNNLICDSTGVYTSYQTSANGADSTVNLILTVNHVSGNTLTVTILENNLPFTLNDSSYTVPGTYYQHFTNAAGCDSTLTIVLNVYYNQTVEVDSTVCQSELPLTWNHVIFTQGGTLSDTLLTSHGADSIVVMTLHVNPVPEAVISGLITLCSDSVVTLTADSAYSYLWSTGETMQTITVAEEGGYTLTVTNEFGCSSTATHYLMPLGNPIISVTVPEMCAGGSYVLSVGYHPDNNIHLGQGATTLSLTDTIFLPDGVYCEPFGCSYRSPLTFTAYADGDTIQSADDIYYVRLNMEHSYIGDLYINITCPNGQKADLLKYGGTGSSECNSQIVSSSRGWNSAGNNMGYSNFFGDAYDYDVSSCDATVFGNEPGVGWNYCWSNNTTQGYVYAPGEGSLIYRFVNAHNGSVDSSDVAAGTQFYHPDDSFSNLIGCPLNGSWYIEVQDGWSYDNGYIFGWELSLSNEMLPDVSFELDYSTAQGPWITPLSDTLFQVDPPADLAHDTTIAYTFTVYDTTGCGYDTTFYITFYATPHTEFDTMVCGSFTWNDSVYTQSGQYVQYLTSSLGCDSVVTCQLTVSPLALTYDTLNIVESQLPYYFAPTNTTFTMQSPLTSSTTYTLTSSQGCDSVVSVAVYIYHNVATQVDTTVCAASLPMTWHGHNYTAAGSFTATLLTTHGADSVVTYTLTVDEIAATIPTVTHVTCFGGSNGAATATVTGGMPNFAYAWTNAAGASISTSTSISNQPAGTYTFTVTDVIGCVATATVTLNTLNDALQPGTIAEDQVVCEGEQPLPFTGTAASGGDNGAYQWQVSANGTDWTPAPGTNNTQNYTYPNVPTTEFSLRRAWVSQSCGTEYSNIVSISLWPNSSDTIEDAVCIGDVYQENGFNITADQTGTAGIFTFEQHFATGHCDSMVVLILTVNPHYEIDLEDVICEGEGYHDNGFSISPLETVGTQQLTRVLNLQSVAGCDSVVTLHLSVIDTAVRIVSLTPDFCENLSAELMVVTDMPNYVWSTGETAPTITVTHSGRYYVTATSGDCSNTAHITVENCDGNQLLLPNAITPSNHDGLNEYFSIPERNLLYINLFEIWIYNRWGELVYYSNDKNFRWNGEYRGKIQYQTVYNYIIRYTDDAGKPYYVKGSVTVL